METRCASLIIYLFCEGDTELGYLQQLAKNRDVRIVLRKKVSAPVQLLKAAVLFAVEHAADLRRQPTAEIWACFDHDDKQREISECADVLSICPDGCPEKGCAHDISLCPSGDMIKRIHVAYMVPCIELWGLICTEEGSKLKNVPKDRHELQRRLHDVMPRYDHGRKATFDVERMTKTDDAISRARQWASTFGEFPECQNATFYAGIAPLVEKIVNSIPPSADGMNMWRRLP